jgi:N-acyl-D-aspartate/D-glutamate deacylase
MEYKGQHFDLKKKMDAIILGMRIQCDSMAAQAETYAQDNAGWTDRTGNARRELLGYAINEDGAMGFGVMHRAKDERTGDIYGKYLEGWDKNTQTLTHKGKYPVLKNTVEHFKEEFLDKIKEVIKNGGSPD